MLVLWGQHSVPHTSQPGAHTLPFPLFSSKQSYHPSSRGGLQMAWNGPSSPMICLPDIFGVPIFQAWSGWDSGTQNSWFHLAPWNSFDMLWVWPFSRENIFHFFPIHKVSSSSLSVNLLDQRAHPVRSAHPPPYQTMQRLEKVNLCSPDKLTVEVEMQ